MDRLKFSLWLLKFEPLDEFVHARWDLQMVDGGCRQYKHCTPHLPASFGSGTTLPCFLPVWHQKVILIIVASYLTQILTQLPHPPQQPARDVYSYTNTDHMIDLLELAPSSAPTNEPDCLAVLPNNPLSHTGYEPNLVTALAADPKEPYFKKDEFLLNDCINRTRDHDPLVELSCRKDERSLASPLLTQMRVSSDHRSGAYHSSREGSINPAAWAMGNLLRESILRGSHKRETSREQINSQDRKLIHDKRRADRRREVEVVLQRKQQAQQMQEEAVREFSCETLPPTTTSSLHF